MVHILQFFAGYLRHALIAALFVSFVGLIQGMFFNESWALFWNGLCVAIVTKWLTRIIHDNMGRRIYEREYMAAGHTKEQAREAWKASKERKKLVERNFW